MTKENIATFSKVSFEEYKKMRIKMFETENERTDDELFDEWKNISLPVRATVGSAGYDFSLPMDVHLSSRSILIPTGIRAKIDAGWVLMLFPRSGLGTKHRFALDNTVGVIDSDYFYADNEGHIMVKAHAANDLDLARGMNFVQGVFLPYGVACGDHATQQRCGGFGSTDKK